MFDDEPAHTAIHDIESFLWVLGHSIIKFSGPGGAPREMTPALKEALSVFVGDHDSQKKKKQILIKDNHFDELLEQVSPEFEVLKGLMRAWRRVLSLAYRYRSGMEFKYPHQAFIRCIEHALEAVHLTYDIEQAGSGGQDGIGRGRAIRHQQTVHYLVETPRPSSNHTSRTLRSQNKRRRLG